MRALFSSTIPSPGSFTAQFSYSIPSETHTLCVSAALVASGYASQLVVVQLLWAARGLYLSEPALGLWRTGEFTDARLSYRLRTLLVWLGSLLFLYQALPCVAQFPSLCLYIATIDAVRSLTAFAKRILTSLSYIPCDSQYTKWIALVFLTTTALSLSATTPTEASFLLSAVLDSSWFPWSYLWSPCASALHMLLTPASSVLCP